MIKHVWTVLCRRSLIDKESNNISIFDVFETLNVNIKRTTPKTTKMNIPIDYELVSLWVRKDTKIEEILDLEVEIHNEKGKVEKSLRQTIKIPKDMKRIRTQLRITGITIETEGTINFVVKIKEGEKYIKCAEIPLEISIKRLSS